MSLAMRSVLKRSDRFFNRRSRWLRSVVACSVDVDGLLFASLIGLLKRVLPVVVRRFLRR